MAHMEGLASDDDLYHPLDTCHEQPDGGVMINCYTRNEEMACI